MTKDVNTPASLPTREELFRKKAETYLVCFADACPRHAACLRWQVGLYTPDTWQFVRCVNPLYRPIRESISSDNAAPNASNSAVSAAVNVSISPDAPATCDLFVSAQPVRMARGMTTTFTDDMPPRVTRHVRQTLIEEVNRPYFFQYRNGQRLIPPALQQRIRALFREAGWEKEIEFDGYVEDYEW